MSENENQKLINLYLEQIKYLIGENISIQNQFLAGVNLPLAALGLLIYNIEKTPKTSGIENIYLLLPFLYLFIPYNLIKFSTRMLSINGYLKHLEQQINELTGKEIFMWNRELINCSVFPGGFSVVTTLGQIPIHAVTIVYLVKKFFEIINTRQQLSLYLIFLIVCLITVLVMMALMLIDTIFVQKKIIKKIDCKKNLHNAKKYTVYVKEKTKPHSNGLRFFLNQSLFF